MREIVILETYPTDGDCIVKDGLSNVFNYTKELGNQIVRNTHYLQGKIVFVAGMPHSFDNLISKNNINVIYTTFETTHIPPRWVDSINKNYDYVIVPHYFVKQSFTNSGVKKPILVNQQGFVRLPRKIYYYEGMGLDGVLVNSKKQNFKVGFCGTPEYRKNLPKLYQACKELQSEIPNLSLEIHSTRISPHFEDKEMMFMDSMVNWSVGKFDNMQLSDWYNSLSCYVYPSSGEGWSYTPREAMFMGVPTIISDIPLHSDLLASGYVLGIKSSGMEHALYGKKYFGLWDRIDVESIRNAILFMYNNYQEACLNAACGAMYMTAMPDMDDSLRGLKHKLKQIDDEKN